jgi:hypothetical protein
VEDSQKGGAQNPLVFPAFTVEPTLVAEITYCGTIQVGLREDKPAEQVEMMPPTGTE